MAGFCTFGRAHPRSRGEHRASRFLSSCSDGSSPLTRGALQLRSGLDNPSGLIPAHAGSTSIGRRSRPMKRAHPRSRGEHPLENESTQGVNGSSPLTRGARDVSSVLYRTDRLIPAHAGSTGRREVSHPSPRAHPRSRGEHLSRFFTPSSITGSSPLTRGALR